MVRVVFSGGTEAAVPSPAWLAVGPDGSVYISQYNHGRVRKVSPDGIITTVAGGTVPGFSGDGGPATLAQLSDVAGMAVASNGTLYLADNDNGRLRAVLPDGIIMTVAGSGFEGTAVDPNKEEGAPATQATWLRPASLAMGPDGGLVLHDQTYSLFRKLARPMAGFSLTDISIASDDASEVYRFDAQGRHLETMDTLTRAVKHTFGYDQAGRLNSVTDVDGDVTTVQRDAAGVPVAVVAPFGQQTTLGLGADGYLSTITDPAGGGWQFTYEAGGLLSTARDPRDKLSRYGYGSTGLLLSTLDPAGGGLTLVPGTTSSGYFVEATTAMGRTTRYGVDDTAQAGHVRTNTFADGTQSREAVSAAATTSTLLPDGTTIAVERKPDARFGMLAPVTSKVTTTTPGGLVSITTNTRTVALADPNYPLSVQTITEDTTVNGRTSRAAYDAATRTWTRTSPSGRRSIVTLDASGRVARTEVPGLEPATTAYDARGRPSTITQGSRVQTFSYDAQTGYLSSVTDALSRATSFLRDPVGRVTQQILPDGQQVGSGYDLRGNLTSVTPPGRPAHGFSYTPVNLLADYVPPPVAGGGVNLTHSAYDLDRRLTTLSRPDLAAVQQGYDAAGRLQTKTIPAGLLTYGYDSLTGKASSIAGPYGVTLGFVYDGSLVTDVTWSGDVSGTVHWGFDNDLRIASETVNGGHAAAFQYDPDGLPTSAGSLTRAYDAQTGLTTGSALGGVTDSFAYDAYGDLRSYAASFTANVLLSVQYSRDALGKITSKTETLAGNTLVYEYGYDVRGRLTDERKDGTLLAHYDYDSNGNRVAETVSGRLGTYDDQDRMLTYGGASFAYTANGELLTKTEAGQTTAYTHDVLGNLLRVALPDGRVVEYVVDGRGRRVGKKVNGAVTRAWLWRDDLQPVAELDGAGTVVARFVYTNGVNVPDYMVNAAGTYRFITDHLGSVRLVADVLTGAVVQRLDYDAWGKVLQDTNPRFQPFGFARGLYDPDTGLVRFGAREYDPETARWTVKDPTGFGAPGTNLYAYASGDPLTVGDATGLQPPPPCGTPNPAYLRICKDKAGSDFSRCWTACDPDDTTGQNSCKRQLLQDMQTCERCWGPRARPPATP
jgi:RHS repeat-associated protein